MLSDSFLYFTFFFRSGGYLTLIKRDVDISLFYPHLFLGTITFFCLIAAIFTPNRAPQLLFWTTVNTLIMYIFVFGEIGKKTKIYVNNFVSMIPNIKLAYLTNFSINNYLKIHAIVNLLRLNFKRDEYLKNALKNRLR